LTPDDLRLLAEEQAALRRVATLVARGVPREEVFAAATEEVGRLLPVDFSLMGRYETDGTIIAIAAWGAPVASFPIGKRWELGGNNLVTIVRETGRPARIDRYPESSSGLIGAVGRDIGFSSTVGAPITVEGQLWGLIAVGSTNLDPPLPAGTEERLAQFTELLATAIANAEGRAGLARLAEEQAALRRVATLVARGVPPEEVFAAVVEEVVRLLGADLAIMGRYASDGTLTSVARSGGQADHLPVGSRHKLGGNNLGTIVFETSRPARVDGYTDASSGPLGIAVHEEGIRSSVATPIMVEGRLWGVIAAGTTQHQLLPADTETRLGSFTERVATAVANTESRAGLARLAEEQAALRRVATLVARGTAPEEVFTAVTEEVVRVLPVDLARMGRYESDGTVTFVAASGWTGAAMFRIGVPLVLEGRNVSTVVAQTGRAARMDNYADASGPIGIAFRDSGLRSGVGTPITVEGRLWGVMLVGSSLDERMPADTEERLAQFTEMLATAVANSESRAGLARLGEEQAALRRVATLVARGTPPEEVFAAVIDEVGQLFPVDYAGMARYEADGMATAVAARGSAHFPVGSSMTLGGKNTATLVFETGRPVRIDGYVDASGPMGDSARERGVRSSVATPIFVEGRLWGTVGAGSTGEQPLPPDTEARLSDFTELVATAIANAESHAALAASRARIITAADESRRRIERDLHDGAQQPLVRTVIVLKLALRALARADANSEKLVAEALGHAEQANAELRELAHGILPAVLTRGGLSAGIEALVSRFSLPVRVDMTVERLPAGLEATAYFVVSEALTNVDKHAQASSAAITAQVRRGHLEVEVRDDGVGGACAGPGTGLGGLEDRVSALNGRLVLESPSGGGTRLCALLPVPGEG
jgi:GAF domain-containing protein